MKLKFKVLFWISIILLVCSNLYWFYQQLESSVGHSYYKVSCEEFKHDLEQLKAVTDGLQTKNQALHFLAENQLEIDTLQKGDHFYITFSSFNLIFDEEGKRVTEY